MVSGYMYISIYNIYTYISTFVKYSVALFYGSVTWMVRPNHGTNMTKRLSEQVFIDVRNNSTKMTLQVKQIARATDAAAVLKKVVELGGKASQVLPTASDADNPSAQDAVDWLVRSGFVVAGKGVVAFEVYAAGSDDDQDDTVACDADSTGGAKNDSPQPNRILRSRPSDAVEMGDPSVRQRFRETLQCFRKHGYNISQFDMFGQMATCPFVSFSITKIEC